MNAISLFTATLLAATLTFAAGKADKKAPAGAVTKHDVMGTLKWTGYGVGKSHAGDLQIKNGQIEMKGTELVGGMFVIDMATLKTPDSEKLQGHLQSPDFFDVAKFPESTFKITKAEAIKGAAAGTPTHKIWGDLTIKGKMNPIELMATVTEAGGKMTAVGTTEIKDRTKFDIVYNSAKFKTVSALGDKLIQDNIKIELNVATK